jgi:arylsulfatase
VATDYPAGDNAYTGTINWVRIDLGTDSHDHLLDPKQLFHFAMTRQ